MRNGCMPQMRMKGKRKVKREVEIKQIDGVLSPGVHSPKTRVCSQNMKQYWMSKLKTFCKTHVNLPTVTPGKKDDR